MSAATFLTGDVFDRMAELPDGSVDLVTTSPPFLKLRSYLPDDHPAKSRELGNEPNPRVFLDRMLQLTEQFRRVLTPHGSIAVELGDTYSGSGGAGGDYGPAGLRAGQPTYSGSERTRRQRMYGTDTGPRRKTMSDEWPLTKSACMVPALYAASLAWGWNLLDREATPFARWRLRNYVAWCRPNPAPGELGDKWRPATSYIAVACTSPRRYWDGDATRYQPLPGADGTNNNTKGADTRSHRFAQRVNSNPAGAPLLDWWELPTHAYAGAHYATWPPLLARRLVETMTPPRVCMECGKPSVRLTGGSTLVDRDGREVEPHVWPSGVDTGQGAHSHKRDGGNTAQRLTLGWSDCGHGAWRPGRVLDPFAGTGTTLAVATGLNRDVFGIDLDERNYAMALDRVGMFLADTEDAVVGLHELPGQLSMLEDDDQ